VLETQPSPLIMLGEKITKNTIEGIGRIDSYMQEKEVTNAASGKLLVCSNFCNL